jgi:type I restriction-modification system DNA methylase subunit
MKKLLEANTAGGQRRISQVFADFCEIAAITLRNVVDRHDAEAHQKRETRYLDLTKTYTPDEVERFAKLLALVTLELEGESADVLGDLYMSLDLGNDRTGQYFTPFTVSSLMAKMTVGDLVAPLRSRQQFVTLSEPTCGSGGMIIAMAGALREQGFNYQRQLHVTAQDIDIVAVHMAYIQLSLLYIPAVVIHGNTLTLEQHDAWPTPAHVLDNWGSQLAPRESANERAS